MIVFGIIWGPAYKYSDSILKDIQKYSSPIFAIDLNLKDKLQGFIMDMYSEEDTPRWKINAKLHYMQISKNPQIKVCFMNVDERKTYFHERKHYYVYSNIEDMKMFVRNKYSKLIDNYFFDIVFHTTDNHKELSYSVSVLKKYLNLTLQDKETLKNITDFIDRLNTIDIKKIEENDDHSER